MVSHETQNVGWAWSKIQLSVAIVIIQKDKLKKWSSPNILCFYLMMAMDAEYLQEVIGNSLAKGLAEVSSVRPADPIEYLASWLLKHEDNMVHRQNNPVSQ